MGPAPEEYVPRLPEAEELRMLRAISLHAVVHAAHHREYRASFHGFHVHALRQRSIPGFDGLRAVSLCVTFGRTLLECELIEMSVRNDLEPIP